MNIFQKQLKINGKRMVDVHNELVEQGEFEYLPHINTDDVPPPAQISVEEFEKSMKSVQSMTRPQEGDVHRDS